MNCPSRTDDVTEEHPTWNQSPPFLAADLTTCQDLNGIANAREHRKGSDGSGVTCGSGHGEKDYFTMPPPQPDRLAWAGGWWSPGPHPRAKEVIGGEGHPLPTCSSRRHPSSSQPQSFFWAWLRWAASVICCAVLLSALRTSEILASTLASFSRASKGFYEAHLASQVAATPTAPSADPHRSSSHLSRRSTCPTTGLGSEADYNTPLHAGALVIILTVSFSACAFPLVAARFPKLRLPAHFFFAVRHFGTGVLLATAFVHLLPTAFILLGNPCLSSFWTDDYPAMPGAIALAGIFFVTIIEMALQPARHMTGSGGDHAVPGGCMSSAPVAAPLARITSRRRSMTNAAGAAADTPKDITESLPMETGPLRGSSASLGRRLSYIAGEGEGNTEPQTVQTREVVGNGCGQASLKLAEGTVADEYGYGYHSHTHFLTPAQKHQKDILQCMMLEVGILFHSVFIGMTLSVSIGHEFIILLIAISFHQTFEGLALGSRIATISWPRGSWQPWMMCLAYGCTTPIGQAIGLATHQLYNPESEFGLVLVGTMNAISSGLLVFASLVELLSEDFLSDESWRVLRGRRRIFACLLVLFGALGMSFVGAWA